MTRKDEVSLKLNSKMLAKSKKKLQEAGWSNKEDEIPCSIFYV
jgi:hypothetical protein